MKERFDKRFIFFSVVSITLIIPILVAIVQTIMGKLVAVMWYYIGFLLYLFGVILAEETIRSIYYMGKVADLRNKNVQDEFSQELCHLTTIGSLNLVICVIRGTIALLIAFFKPNYFKWDNDNDLDFNFWIPSTLLDIILIGY